MIRRLRSLLAHARAGHRIGCETCVWQEAEAEPGFADRLDAAIDRMDRDGLGVPYTPPARPHTLYVADPDELRRDGRM